MRTQGIQLLCSSQAYSSDKERVEHIYDEHPAKMYYSTPEDLRSVYYKIAETLSPIGEFLTII